MNLKWFDNLCYIESTGEVMGWIKSGIIHNASIWDTFLSGDRWKGTFVGRDNAMAHVEQSIKQEEGDE